MADSHEITARMRAVVEKMNIRVRDTEENRVAAARRKPEIRNRIGQPTGKIIRPRRKRRPSGSIGWEHGPEERIPSWFE